MLVPSTFTGWYRKIMMKAEIASETTRSRNHTESTGKVRGATGAAPLPGRVRDSSGRPWSGMLIMIIRAEATGLKPDAPVPPRLPRDYCRGAAISVTIIRLRASES